MSYAELLYGLCPVCETHALPKGKIVCCQNPECLAIVNAHDNTILGSFKGGAAIYSKHPMKVVSENERDKK